MFISKQIFGVVLFFVLACPYEGLATTADSEHASTISTDSSSSSLLLAAKKKKASNKTKKKKSKKTDSATSEKGATDEETSTSSPSPLKPMGVKGLVGTLTGSSLLSGIVLGGDFIYLITNPITIEGGATFTLGSKDVIGDRCTDKYALQTFDAGGIYHMFVGSAISIDAGARVGLGMYKDSRACDALPTGGYTDEEPEQGSFSGNSPLLGIQGGASYHIPFGGMAASISGEVRKPIFFSNKFKDFSVIYLLLGAKLGF